MSSATKTSRAPLFTPYPFGNHSLRNRIVMAPMTRTQSPGGVPGANVAEYYRRRAEGGVGLIITEGTTVNHMASNAYPNVPRFYGEDALEGWEKVVEAVHSACGQIAPQIWHTGPMRRPGIEPDPTVPGYGPSEIVEDGKIVVHEMSLKDIHEVVLAFGQAAADAERLGFDGVEIHGAHEYLIDAFLWKGHNHRTDEYGGSLANRVRFATEVVKEVRRRVSGNFPVIFRFSQWKLSDYDAKIAENEEELRQILLPLSEAGVDIFHASSRRFWAPVFEASPETLAAMTKRITGKPVIAVGNFGLKQEFRSGEKEPETEVANLDKALQLFAQGDFEMIAAGRVLLSDPDWVNKVRDEQDQTIRFFTDDSMKSLVV